MACLALFFHLQSQQFPSAVSPLFFPPLLCPFPLMHTLVFPLAQLYPLGP